MVEVGRKPAEAWALARGALSFPPGEDRPHGCDRRRWCGTL